MQATQAPLFLDLTKAREWVNEQSLDEAVYLIEFHASSFHIGQAHLHDAHRGDIPVNLYEFFTLTEYNELIESREELVESGFSLGRQVRLVERWS